MRQRIMEGLTLSSSPSSSPSSPLLLLRTAGNHAHLCCRKQPSLIRYSSSRSSGRSSISIRHSRLMRALSDPKTEESSLPEEDQAANVNFSEIENGVSSSLIDKNISQAVKKTAATFAPRSSTKSKNPAVPGSTLYTVFEVQAYMSMVAGGFLSFNLVFPSSEPDLWRLMGMWSIWMFTIPSLRARDCSSKEKDALNYLFLGIPLINVLLPLFWKSFAAVWTADALAFFAVYAWKLNWLSDGKAENEL